MPSFATLGTLVALVVAGAIAVAQARSDVAPGRPLHRWFAVGTIPALLTLAAFLSDASSRRILIVAVVLLGIATYGLAYAGIVRLAARPSALSIGATLGLVTVLGELYVFGGMLQNRLAFQPDPTGDLYTQYSPDSALGLVLALAPVPAVLGAALALPATRRRWRDAEAPSRLYRLRSWIQRLCAWLRRPLPQRGISSPTLTRDGRRLLLGAIVILVVAALPVFAGSGSSRITVGEVAVSEWLRPFAYLGIAAALVHNRVALIADISPLEAPLKFLRLLVVALALPGGLIALGVARNDFGSILPLAFAFPAALLSFAARDQTAYLTKSGFADESLRRVRGGVRWVLTVLLVLTAAFIVLVSVFAFLQMPVGKSRIGAWENPWQYAWTVDPDKCKEVTTYSSWVGRVPNGYSVCIQNYAELLEADKSQMAKVLTAVDGGGLWGRGLSDSEARLVPVRDSDFVLASVWSKLGALVVLALTALTVVVWYILARCMSRQGWIGRRSAGADRLALYGSALGAAIAGQAVYVLAATANVLPHSGVPFPFVARGGQAMGGLVVGVLLLIGGLRKLPAQGASARTTEQRTLAARGPLLIQRNLGFELAVSVAVGAILVGLLNPFGARLTGPTGEPKRVLRASGLEHPDVRAMIRGRGTAPTVTVAGTKIGGDYATGLWSPISTGSPPLPIHDLFGVLRTTADGAPGLLEGTTDAIKPGSVSRTIADRLRMPAQDSGALLDLTVDPALQRAVATAARAPLRDASRLPAGAVVLDARSGAVLALTSSPDQPDHAATTAPDDEVRAWREANGKPGEKLGDGTIALPNDQRSCSGAIITCAVYSLKRTPRAASDESYLRTYVGGTDAKLPPADNNRAVGRGYQLGSTFKVIVAAAYLEGGTNRKVTDRIPAPGSVTVGGQNKGKRCRGTVNGLITVADALRVSCNNAFITLARKLGWTKVGEVARRLGFTLVGPGAPAPSTLWPAPSTVPATANDDEIGVAAIGGGNVTGTPYGMAALMATVVNGGTYHQPFLVTGGTDSNGAPVSTPQAGVKALSASTVAGLAHGLATVTGEDGTLADVDAPAGIAFVGKSGTHVRQGVAPSDYVTHFNWVVGAASRPGKAPIAFAVVTEGHDATDGHDKVRVIVKSILDVYAE